MHSNTFGNSCLLCAIMVFGVIFNLVYLCPGLTRYEVAHHPRQRSYMSVQSFQNACSGGEPSR